MSRPRTELPYRIEHPSKQGILIKGDGAKRIRALRWLGSGVPYSDVPDARGNSIPMVRSPKNERN